MMVDAERPIAGKVERERERERKRNEKEANGHRGEEEGQVGGRYVEWRDY